MARKLRDKTAGTFHVYTHCVWAAHRLFYDNADRMTFLRELARVTAAASWTCIGYCLMGSHYHLILDVDAGVLPDGMHALNFRYACMFNARHGMKGHVFAARYDSPRIHDDDHLLTVYRYVMQNPVRGGMSSEPADWPWSSYASAVGLADPISFVNPMRVLNAFDAPTRDEAIAQLRRFVEGRDDLVRGPGPRRGSAGHGLANGWESSYVLE